MGIYKEDRLVGHVPIELSRIISYFLQESETKEVKVAVNGKGRGELGLVVPGKYCARTESNWTVKVLGDQLKIIKEIYIHFSWQYEEQEMYYKVSVKKWNIIMQNSLLNLYYICWMELNYIKPNPLSLGETFI